MPQPKPPHIPTGPQGQCFANAFRLALDDPSLTYCEGYALYRGTGTITHHAWVTDGRGNAVDNTWDRVGVAYAGVPFDIDFLNLRHLRYEAVVCVLDDWEHDWPILSDPADRPAEWFTENGRGTARLKGS